jgi:hypothetical protein
MDYNDFPDFVVEACRKLGYKVSDATKKRVVFEITNSSKSIYCHPYQYHFEFTCRSAFEFDDLDKVPGKLALHALRENARWNNVWSCLEKVSGRYVFSTRRMVAKSILGEWLDILPKQLIECCRELEEGG